MNSDKIVQFYIEHNATLDEVIELRRYLDELEYSADKLNCLYAYGVDNWFGYEEALQEVYKKEDEEE